MGTLTVRTADAADYRDVEKYGASIGLSAEDIALHLGYKIMHEAKGNYTLLMTPKRGGRKRKLNVDILIPQFPTQYEDAEDLTLEYGSASAMLDPRMDWEHAVAHDMAQALECSMDEAVLAMIRAISQCLAMGTKIEIITE